MTTQTRIAVTNRTICYELYKQAGLASAEDSPLTCLSRQIRVLLNNNSYDKILVREKDLSVEEYHEFIADIFSAQHSYPTRPPIILHLQKIRSPLTQDQIILPSQNLYALMEST